MTDPLIKVDISDSVAWLELNRPEAMNALNTPLLDALTVALTAVDTESSVRVVVLTGAGKAFCAGADLKGLSEPDGSINADTLLTFVRHAGATIERISALSKPVIAAVNGYAVAGGIELALSCDLVIAAESARLGDGHANYGLLPGAGGAARLARVVGPMVAKYLAFTGEAVAAADLVPYGLVNEAVPDSKLRSRVAELAARIATKSPRGLAHMKRLINDGLEQPLATALRLEHQALAVHAHSADLHEGLAAFREKRTPNYSGH